VKLVVICDLDDILKCIISLCFNFFQAKFRKKLYLFKHILS